MEYRGRFNNLCIYRSFPIVDYVIIQKTSIEIEKHIFLKDENDIENICFSDDVEGIKGENINFSYDDKNVLENLSFFNFPTKEFHIY